MKKLGWMVAVGLGCGVLSTVHAQTTPFPDIDDAVAAQLGGQLPLLSQAGAVTARAGANGWFDRQYDLRGTREQLSDTVAGQGGGVWGRVFYGSADHEVPWDGAVANDYEQRLYGFSAGFDMLAGSNWLMGMVVGYTRSTVEFDQLGSDADFDGVGAGVYASWFNDSFFVDAMLRHDWISMDLDAPALEIQSDDDQFSTDMGTWGLHVEGGWKALGRGNGLSVEPLVNLSWVKVRADALNLPPQDPMTYGRDGDRIFLDRYESRRAAIGVRASLAHTIGGDAQLQYSVLLRHWREFERESNATVRVLDDDGDPVADVGFGHRADSGLSELNLGLGYTNASGRVSLMLNATGYTASHVDGWHVTTGLRYQW